MVRGELLKRVSPAPLRMRGGCGARHMSALLGNRTHVVEQKQYNSSNLVDYKLAVREFNVVLFVKPEKAPLYNMTYSSELRVEL